MKTVVIVHDIGYSNVDKMMRDIDYVASSSKSFDGEFIIILENNSALETVISGSGLPYEITDKLPEEPDVVISFTYDDMTTEAHKLVMNQWASRRPVHHFQVIK